MAKQKAEKSIVKNALPIRAFTWHSLKGYSILVFLFSFLLYFNSIFNNYNLDDELVTRNHRLTSKGISAIPEIFSSPYYQDEVGYKYEYRPMVLVSFAIEHSVFGENPHISHLINVLLYSLLCVVLLQVLAALFKDYSLLLPVFVTFFFAAHPVHTEVVASIKNRDEILSLLFGLLSLYFAVQYASRKLLFALFLVPIFFLLGILSKSTIITFGLLIPVSLILLTTISLARVLSVTALLAFPTVFFSRVPLIALQVIMFVGIFVAVVVLYYAVKINVNLPEIKQWILRRYDSFKKDSQPGIDLSESLNYGFLKGGLVLASIIFLVTILIAIAIVAIYNDRLWFTVLPLAVFALVFAKVRNELKLLFISPLTIITLLVLVNFNAPSRLLEAGLVVFIVSQFINNSKPFKIVAAVNYLIYALVSFWLLESLLFITVLMFVGFFHRKLFAGTIFSLVVVGAFLVKFVFQIFAGSDAFKLAHLAIPFICLSILLLWKNKHHLLFKFGGLSIPIILVMYLLLEPPGNSLTIAQDLGGRMHEINTIKAPDPTPVQSLRPVKYMEYPIDKNDPWSIKFGTSMVILGRYLKLIFIPYPLSYYYGYAYIVPTSFWNIVPISIFLIHVLLVGIALFFLKKSPLVTYALLFYLINIFVFSGIVMPVPGMMADRFLFIPSIGFCILLVVFLMFITKQNHITLPTRFGALNIPLRISALVLLVGYSLTTFSRNPDWKDHVTLFSKDIKAVENSAQAQNLLGLHLFLSSNNEKDAATQLAIREEATTHFKRALEIYPDFLNAAFDLGRTYESMQRKDKAYEAYELAVKIDTNFYAPYFSMAVIQHNKGNLALAVPLYEKFLVKYPYQLEAYANLSFAYYKLGEYQMAIATNRRVLTFQGNSYQPYVNIGQTFVQLNIPDSAIYYFEKALQLQPSDQFVINRLEEVRKIKK